VTLNGPRKDVYAARRTAALARLSGAVLFLPGAPEAIYPNDVHYPYRPDSYVRYLSGFEEPASLLLASTGADSDGFVLFVRPRDPQAETWTGERAGVEGACNDYGADRAYPLDEALSVLEKCLSRATALYYAVSPDRTINERVSEVVHKVNAGRPRAGGAPISTTEAGALLDEMCVVKSVEEVELMRATCAIAALAHKRVMETLRPGMYEYEVQAGIEHDLRSRGCAGPAYGTIAAGGANATVLHYVRNDRRLADGELLLLDAGGEYGGYCADITRTMPVGRVFSPAQAALYDIVLEAQKRAIDAVSPEVTHEEVHKLAVRTLVEGMLEQRLLSGTVEECVSSEAFKRYFMHGTGHWLGMDVHDVGSYRNGDGSRRLQPGIVLTVEPGIYVRQDADAPAEFRGIGIRIEDDVLVTDAGHEVMTSGAPKERADIEALRSRALRT
jgi:Xaa-Pro aminopeptidase